MKKSRLAPFIIILVLLDQLSKLLVKAFARADSLNKLIYFQTPRGWFMLHIHPELHDRYPLGLDIVIAGLSVLLTAALMIYFRYERSAILRDIPGSERVGSSPAATKIFLIFWISGIICSTFLDAFLWGGSLDFICFERAKFFGGDEPYTITRRLDIDLKDVFLDIGLALFLWRMLVFKITQFRLPKEFRRIITRRENHIFRSINEARSEAVLSAPRQEFRVADVLIITVVGLICAAGFGFAIYLFSIWVIIPLSCEIFPALDKYLNEIGDRYDPEMIYQVIKNACMTLGLFPGMYASNAGVKRRQRAFSHDTGGMILWLDGLKYHLARHLPSDLTAVFLTVLLGYSLYAFGLGSVSPFTVLYGFAGPSRGVFISIFVMISAQIFGIFYAQKAWRAACFYGE